MLLLANSRHGVSLSLSLASTFSRTASISSPPSTCNPIQSALLYLALDKKASLAAMFRAVKNDKLADFMASWPTHSTLQHTPTLRRAACCGANFTGSWRHDTLADFMAGDFAV